MARPAKALGRRQKFALVQESTALTLEAHSAGDFLRTLGASMTLPRLRELHADADKGVAANAYSAVGIEAKAAFTANVRPSGSSGGAAELDPVLTGAFGAASTPGATTEDGGTSTTTSLDVVDASGYTAGDLLWLATTGEALQVESIATNDITPSIPLSTAPTSGEAVSSGKQFTPSNDLSPLSAYLDDDVIQRAAAGAIINGLTFAFSPNALLSCSAELDMSGKRSFAGTGALASTHAIGAGALILSPGQGARFSVLGGNIKVTVDAGNAGEETHTVTAVSADTLTLSGTLAAEQLAGVEVSFYSVSATHTGTPLSGINGAAIVDLNHNGVQTRLVLPLRACEYKLTNGYVWSSDYGNEHRNVYERESENPREVMWSPTVRLTKEAATMLGLANADVTGSIVVWAGNSVGDIFALGSRKVQWDVPEFDSSPGALTTIKLTGRALESTDGGADETRAAFL